MKVFLLFFLLCFDFSIDNNGEIDFEEFVAVMSRKVNASYTSDQVINAFKVFEGNSPNGYVGSETIVNALTTYGSEKISEEQARELVGQMEADGIGLINYADYVNLMMN